MATGRPGGGGVKMFISKAEAARELGISRQRVYQLIDFGKLKTVMWYGAEMLLRSSVEERKRERSNYVGQNVGHIGQGKRTIRRWRVRVPGGVPGAGQGGDPGSGMAGRGGRVAAAESAKV